MSYRTIVIQMEIIKEFGLARHHGVINLTTVKKITLPELKFPPFLNIIMMLRRRMNLQRMKWWMQLRRKSKDRSQPMGRR